MGLYAVLNNHGTPIAYHENKRVVKEFLSNINNKSYYYAKVKHPKDVEDTNEYADLYLVQVGRQYIPSIYYDDADILTTDRIYEYDSLVNVLTRELEFETLTKSEKKALEKTLAYFKDKINQLEDEPIDYEACKRSKELRNQMEYLFWSDEQKEGREY